MRFAISLAALLALAGCNAAEQTASNIDAAVEGSADEIGNLAERMGNAVDGELAEAENAIVDTREAIDRVDWIGRWTGVEGTYLVVRKGDGIGRYTLEMQYTLDDSGTFAGTANADGIAFTRPDGAQQLRHTDGAATGLKYLAGKKDCLTVKTGEGYCRD